MHANDSGGFEAIDTIKTGYKDKMYHVFITIFLDVNGRALDW